MNKRRKINWTFITILLLNFFGILFIKLYDQNKYLKTREGIEENGAYAIGIITLTPPKGELIKQGGAERIMFTHKGHLFEGDAVSLVKRTEIGNKYIIAFDTTNIKHCIVLYDYPVTDSTQFLKDVEYLKQYPPIPYFETLIWKCFKNKEKLW